MFSRNRTWWEQREIADPEERRDGAGPKRWVAYERNGEPRATPRTGTSSVSSTAAARRSFASSRRSAPRRRRCATSGVPARDRLDRNGRSVAAAAGPSALPPARARRDGPLSHGRRSLGTSARRRRRTVRTYVRERRQGRLRRASTSSVRGTPGAGSSRAVRPPEQGEAEPRSAGRSRSAQPCSAEFSFAALARAGRVEELEDGAIARADSLFRWDRHPWCPEIF